MTGTGWAAVGSGWGAVILGLAVVYNRLNTRIAVLEERTRTGEKRAAK